MFIRTLQDNLLIGPRCYARGSVVEVEDARGESEVRGGFAGRDPGPASEPDPAAGPELAPPQPKGRRKASPK